MLFESNVFGIDLGTSNLKVYSKKDDNVVIEKNVIAIENNKNAYAYGDDAFDMLEKSPYNIKVSNPIRYGRISEIRNTELILKHFLTDISKGRLHASEYLMAVPTEITKVEKRAFFELIRNAGIKAKKVMMVEKAVATGLGMHVDTKENYGAFIVDVGYETTEISIISQGGIVVSRLLKIGGVSFDEAIQDKVKKELGLVIGRKTAEIMKIKFSDQEKRELDTVIYGRAVISGLPVQRTVSLSMLVNTFKDQFRTIADSVKILFDRTPPEYLGDIRNNGIYLTGGGALISGLKESIEEQTGLRVTISEHPITASAFGLARIINDEDCKKTVYIREGKNR